MDYSKRTQHQLLVDQLMVKAGQEIPTEPTIPGQKVRLLRSKINGEEFMESNEGLGVAIYVGIPPGFKLHPTLVTPLKVTKDNVEYVLEGEPNLKEIIDGGGDMLVTVTGMLSACGVNDHSILMAIDENNLKKFGPGGYRREDGKWMKPPDHKPPDIEGVLNEQKLEREIWKISTKEQKFLILRQRYREESDALILKYKALQVQMEEES